ncbi:MAG: TM1812 family CRISPR-associated protein [Candidatus Omnitrophica bacterium]|nr:TM1812 family CRISPR-associated protein [Candidatus Omnitrophota bacterium]
MIYTLITTIGTSDYKEIEYEFDGRKIFTPYPSVALCKLLPSKPKSILAFLTEEAREKNWARYRESLKEASGIEPELVIIPAGRNEGELIEIFRKIVDSFQGKGRELDIILDITFAFRSLQFIFFVTTFYLSSHPNYKLKGIYYGALEQKVENCAPIINLQRLIRMVEWYYSVRTFQDTGSLVMLSRLFQKISADFAKSDKNIEMVSAIRDSFNKLVFPLDNALPLECGLQARMISKKLSEIRTNGIVEELPEWKMIGGEVDSLFSWLNFPPEIEITAKSQIVLDENEIKRELKLIEFYLKHKRVQEALLLMREWLINLLLWVQGVKNWLDKDERYPNGDKLLGYWRELFKTNQKDKLNTFQTNIAELFNQVADLRNDLAHCGFDVQNVQATSDNKLETIFKKLEMLIEDAKKVSPEDVKYPREESPEVGVRGGGEET